VFAAARTATAAAGEQRWAIGVDTDQYLEVDSSLQPFILTSMVKRYDLVVTNLVEQFLDGRLDSGTRRMTLADRAMSLSDSGGHLDADLLAAVDRLRDDVASGAIDVPTIASGALLPPPNLGTTVRVEVRFDGETCSVEGPSTVPAGTPLELEAHNDTRADAAITIETSENGVAVAVAADGTTTGFVAIQRTASVLCYPNLQFDRGVLGGEIDIT